MKSELLRLEHNLLRLAAVRFIVRALIAANGRGRWLWGRIRFGALVSDRGIGCVCAHDAELKYPQNLKLGARVIIGSGVSLGAHSPIFLGNDVRISRDVIIETAGLDFLASGPPYAHVSEPVVVENGVWIGARAIILGGVTIGEKAVIAAGAVVSRSVPAGATVAGIPARSIAKRNDGAKDG